MYQNTVVKTVCCSYGFTFVLKNDVIFVNHYF